MHFLCRKFTFLFIFQVPVKWSYALKVKFCFTKLWEFGIEDWKKKKQLADDRSCDFTLELIMWFVLWSIKGGIKGTVA